MPVTFPPGCARLWTSPTSTGKLTAINTFGTSSANFRATIAAFLHATNRVDLWKQRDNSRLKFVRLRIYTPRQQHDVSTLRVAKFGEVLLQRLEINPTWFATHQAYTPDLTGCWAAARKDSAATTAPPMNSGRLTR
jgi:hypothetical protein